MKRLRHTEREAPTVTEIERMKRDELRSLCKENGIAYTRQIIVSGKDRKRDLNVGEMKSRLIDKLHGSTEVKPKVA